MTTEIRRYGWYGIIGSSFMWLLHTSWFRWGNLIVDTFRDQWIFYKLSQGAILYRDLYYEYGFLPPYIVSFFYKVFGVHTKWSIFVGITVTFLTTIFVYRIGRLFLNRLFSTILTLSFLFLFAFGNYNAAGICNFILPYSIASTFFIMFAMGSMYCFLKFILTDRKAYLVWWTIVLCCAFLSRIDYSCFVWGVYSAVGFFYLFVKRRIRDTWYFVLAPTIAAVIYLVFVVMHNAQEGFYESLFHFFSFVGSGKSHFSLVVAGFTNVLNNLRLVGISFAVHIILLASFYFLSVKMCTLREKYPRRITTLLTYLFVVLCSFFVSRVIMNYLGLSQFRLFPVMLVGGIFFYLYEISVRRNLEIKKATASLVLFGIALVLISVIILKAGPLSYGFYLAVPSLVCYYIFCLELYPSLFRDIPYTKEELKKYYSLCVVIFLIVSAIPFLQSGPLWWRSRTADIDFSPRGKITYTPGVSTQRFKEALAYIATHVVPEETIVVFPEGASINFMTRRDNPTRYHTFMPNHVAIIGEENIIRQFEQHAIDYIIIVNRPTSEYGYPFFGVHYGKEIVRWMRARYSLEKVIGPFPFRRREFGAMIYKSKRKRSD